MAKKRRRKKVNPVREWISDNLRYLLLILIVVIAALVAFLVYRGVSGRNTRTAEPTSVSTEASSANSSSVSASSEETEAPAKTEVVTATPTPTETPTPTPTPTPEPTPEVVFSEEEGAQSAVQDYFYSLQVNGEYPEIEYYDSIHVQTVPGITDGTYVAYADYEYKYWNYDSTVPGLTEFYLEADESGALQIVDNVPADVQTYISNVRQTETVQSLIKGVQDRYQQVMEADPDLAAYISGLG